MKLQEISRMKNEYRFYLSGEPKPPCNRIIREGDVLEKCWICGSTLKRWFFKVIGCIQPECPNYHGRRK